MRFAWAISLFGGSAEPMSRAAPRPGHAATLRLLYLTGVMQGLALITFPAASAIFTSSSAFGLSSTQYGAMFIPQVALAILASALGPRLARRSGLRGTLLLGLSGDILSMALLSASPLASGSSVAFDLLLLATGALGLGFGATVMTLNALVENLSPGRADSAVLALNALLGLGTALAPLLVTLFSALGAWWALPLLMTVFAALLLIVFAIGRFSLDVSIKQASARRGVPARFWLYALAALLYGVVETLSGNWSTLYLTTERHLVVKDASFALTAFWVMVTLGRVGFATTGRLLPDRLVYVALPMLLAIVFQAVAHAHGAALGIASFGAAGLACSALLPLSISFASTEFPGLATTMSGGLLAAYQIGYGAAAFGVGPLHESGVAFSRLFSLASLVALALALVAWRVTRIPAISWRAP